MTNEKNWEKKLSDNSLTILAGILLVATISIVVVVGVYWYYFNNQLVLIDPEPWGQFGDFLGGTLNPIFGFLSVMALLAALVIQGRELKVSSEELRNSALALNAQNKAIAHQSFEQTFFSWLENYRDMLGSIEYVVRASSGNVEFSGRTALRRWWSDSLEIDNVVSTIGTQNPEYAVPIYYPGASNEIFHKVAKVSPDLLTATAFESWELIYRKNEYQLDSLFRNLYRLILWIDSQHEDRINSAQKWLYVSIVRAQLSWIEMVYLFYNGHTERGKNFKKLTEKYALFDNLNFGSDLVIAHIKEHGHNNARYADSVYDSCLARQQLGLPESIEETLAKAVV